MSTLKGRAAEDVACQYLEQQGYRILERNRRLGRGELDMIALFEDIVVFIEVKAHQKRTSSLEAMHQNKQQRMISAAQTWLGLNMRYANYQCRFDLLLVIPAKINILPPHIEHIPDIIRL